MCLKTLRKAGAGGENRDGRSSLHLNYSVPCGIRFMKLRRAHDAVCSRSLGGSMVRAVNSRHGHI